ncbi:MAG: energy transducer TonB [Verrucomicrobiota bacterium]
MNKKRADNLKYWHLGWLQYFFVACLIIDQNHSATIAAPPAVKLAYYPLYPREQLLNGDVGNVKVLVLVDKKGRVSDAKVEVSSHPAFANAALRAIRNWRFEPFVVDGVARSVKVRQPFRFVQSVDSFFALEPLKRYKKSSELFPVEAYKPAYPRAFNSYNSKDYCDVIITMNELGKVVRTEIEQVTHPVFIKPSIEAAKLWKFTPFTRWDNFERMKGYTADFINESYGRIKMRLTFLYGIQLGEELEMVQEKILKSSNKQYANK